MAHPSEPENYYAILGVARTATAEEIRTAYRERAKALHPDMNRQRDTKEQFQRVREAYAVLSRVEERQRYDFQTRPTPLEPAGYAATASVPMPMPVPPKRRVRGIVRWAIPAVALAPVIYLFLAPDSVELTVAPPKIAEVDKEMEAVMARSASSFMAPPPESPYLEIAGKGGQKLVVARSDYKRLAPIHERLVTESKQLQKRKEELDAQRAELEKEQRQLASARPTLTAEFRIKVDAFNRDGATLRRHLELHTAEVEDYFKQVERMAAGGR
jgi:curved DNA-binding protein CbpA